MRITKRKKPQSQALDPRTRLFVLSIAGVLALLLSCSSDQVGYDVKFDVIPSTETDGTNALRPIEVSVSISPDSPTFTLGGRVDSDEVITIGPSVDPRWTAAWHLEKARREDGKAPGFDLSMDLTKFTWDGPVDFVVLVLSSYISGRNSDYVPVSPATCSFQLDPNTASLVEAGNGFAQHMNQCLSDWVVQNGVPHESDVQVTSSWAPAYGFRDRVRILDQSNHEHSRLACR